MNEKMISKSLRLTIQDKINLDYIVKNWPGGVKGRAEAMKIAFEVAASAPPCWRMILQATEKCPQDLSEGAVDYVLSFWVNQQDFQVVLESVNSQLNTSRPRFSYLARLCIANLKTKLKEKPSVSISQVPKDILSISEFAELSVDDKLAEIYKILVKDRLTNL